jgi:hypothetical protein
MKSVASNMAPLATAVGISESKDAVQYGNRANLPSHRLRATGGRRAAIHRRDPLRSWQTNHCAAIEQKVEKHRECVSVPPSRVLSFGNLVRAASRPDPGIIPRLVPDDNPFWKPSESRLCERSAKANGLSEALVERQLAWASRGRRSPTRCRSWGSLARRSDGPLASAPNLCLLISRPEYSRPIAPLA